MALPGRIGLLHLAVLANFAFAQPIFALFEQFPTFLVAHRSTPTEIVLLVFALCLVVPAVVVGLALAGRLFGARAGAIVFLVLMAVLIALIVAPPLVRSMPRPGWLTVAVAALLGSGVTAAYRQMPLLRFFVTLLTPAWLVFPLVFVFNPGIASQLRGDVDPKAFYGQVECTAPVVMVVFDGFPLSDLLTVDGQIDEARYPNFAALAGQSTWFRNATSVHQLTGLAVPAILTGNYPVQQKLPVLRDHPYNLFTLLGAKYELNAFECLTLLCPQTSSVDRATLSDDSLWDRFRVLLGDTGLVYLHAVLPPDFTSRLPGVTNTWRNFLGASADDIRTAAGKALLDRSQRYEDFIASIAPSEKPRLDFLHLLLPHPPSVHAPSGKLFLPPNYQFTPGLEETNQIWMDDDWLTLHAYQRHLLQVALVDRLLGEMIARLKQAGRWDDALVVVTADHGDSFWPGQAKRDPSQTTHPEDIVCVPLFIKAPGQTQGEISDRNVETIDILPTIADVLDVELPWKVDGQSALATELPERKEKVIVSRGGTRQTFPPGRLDMSATLRRKAQNFAAGADPEALFRYGPRPDLIGREVTSLKLGQADAGSVALDESLMKIGQMQGDRWIPAYYVGTCRLAAPAEKPPNIAIAVNGRIEAVVPSYPQDASTLGFMAVVREEAVSGAKPDVRFYAVTGDASSTRLQPLRAK